jgi:hypothetical protein
MIAQMRADHILFLTISGDACEWEMIPGTFNAHTLEEHGRLYGGILAKRHPDCDEEPLRKGSCLSYNQFTIWLGVHVYLRRVHVLFVLAEKSGTVKAELAR